MTSAERITRSKAILGDWTWQLAAGILIGLGVAMMGLALYNLIWG